MSDNQPDAAGDDLHSGAAMIGLLDCLQRTVTTLEMIEAPMEALGEFKAQRRFSIIRSAPVLEPVGRVWRLGVLLIDRQGALYSTGQVTRAIEPLRAVTNRSDAAELRREYRRAATRGHFVTGEVVNHDFAPIALDEQSLRLGSGPLSIMDDTVMVRWDTGQGANGIAELAGYLTDRASLFSLD